MYGGFLTGQPGFSRVSQAATINPDPAPCHVLCAGPADRAAALGGSGAAYQGLFPQPLG